MFSVEKEEKLLNFYWPFKFDDKWVPEEKKEKEILYPNISNKEYFFCIFQIAQNNILYCKVTLKQIWNYHVASRNK